MFPVDIGPFPLFYRSSWNNCLHNGIVFTFLARKMCFCVGSRR